jgi:diguanylate cyclase (GGDEF)-like protein
VPILASGGFVRNTGLNREDALAWLKVSMFERMHPDDVGVVSQISDDFLHQRGPYDIVFRCRMDSVEKDPEAVPEYVQMHGIGKWQTMPDGMELAVITYANLSKTREATLNKVKAYEMFRQDRFYTDPLTGLPNTNYLYEFGEEKINTVRAENRTPYLIYANISSMQSYNNNYGFDEGDRLLCLAAKTLKEQFPKALLTRVSDDHFVVITRIDDEKELSRRLNEANSIIRRDTHGNITELQIGVAPVSEDIDLGKALDHAKHALKYIDNERKRHKSCCSFFDRNMMEVEKNRQGIIDNLDRAIEEGWIKVYYQPIVRSTNGKVCDVEALARWDDPVRGLLSPALFIPILEKSLLIHRLDLCVVKHVLSDLKTNEQNGNQNVPVSINFSRADFDACDLVQEICKLVDEAQIDRKLINIEITESMVGSDFDYMKKQIERFRAQGFQVWMDDFGSGYSSLDVLQSIKFDLIKFDMGFMRRLDESDDGKIILKEMMKMATSLGIDTICEGVETESQARFLQEIACSKLQGYYFSKPVPPAQIMEKYTVEIQDGFEDPSQSAYYDALGSVNLYDLSFLANLDDNAIKNTFVTVPIGIMEVKSSGDAVRYVRINQAFREFMNHAFGFDLSDPETEYTVPKEGPGSSFMKAVEQCRNNGNRAFVDEEMDDGSTVHSFVRRISVNPVTGTESVAIAVLSITPPDENTTYADIARALAADYYNLFVIDLDTNDYTEYASQVGGEEMSVVRHGKEFFESARRDTLTRIYEEDREPFLALFTKENVLRDLDAQGVFTTTYRLIDTGNPMYVNMKITRMRGGNRIILGISIIDSQMQQREQYEELRRERESMVRVMALSDGYLTLFTIDPKTGKYIEYSSSDDFDSLGAKKDGNDFFGQAYVDAFTYCYEEDRQRFQEQVTQENVLRVIRERGNFSIDYRLIIRGKPRPVTLKAALFKEGGVEKLVVGVRAWKDRSLK